ncbi:amphi-Trp domain-containing protein [Geoglobus acetivorans]|uniref:Amphi-Trp domain-containing protein n=1 Tax=Geoglobus acetivorans TaxID=565033 RepID=A0ABZ3H1B3_GEOAI|nr:amphi-Trp domain-containing protein [Geoglobus acetivorans]
MIEISGKDAKREADTAELEFETHMSKEELLSFLRLLAEQIEKENAIHMLVDDIEVKFDYGFPVEVEVEHESSKKLKIKLEFKKRHRIELK